MVILRKLDGKLMLIRGSTGWQARFLNRNLISAADPSPGAAGRLVTTRPRWRSSACLAPGRFNTRMSDTRIDFSAPATLRKWPSVNNERVSASLGARTYMIIEGTLDECIQQFMQLREGQRHLYEIHTAPQSDLVGAILSTEHVVELARLRDFLGK